MADDRMNELEAKQAEVDEKARDLELRSATVALKAKEPRRTISRC